MIIYEASIDKFSQQCCKASDIADLICENLLAKAGITADDSLRRSFEHSLPEMSRVLSCELFDKEINIAIEYRLETGGRADFIIYGKDEFDHNNLVVVELKQWSTARTSKKPNYVHTNGGDGEKDYWHPSYQAYNYINLLRHLNEYVREQKIQLNACSFLHYMDNSYDFILNDASLFPKVIEAPAFLKDDADKLRNFIKRHVSKPNKQLLYYIDNGEISPSKELVQMLNDSLKGNSFFSYDENQAEAVATIYEKTVEALDNGNRATIIIKGGPGTGKSVVAINAMAQIISHTKPRTNKHNNVVYVTQNMAPRYYFKDALNKDTRYTDKETNAFFKTPHLLNKCPDMEYDCVLVDEAHRIISYKPARPTSYTYMKPGTNLLEQIFRGSKVNVFFIDEDQAVTAYDYATVDLIKKFAKQFNSPVFEGKELSLTHQYRCVGGATYINWIKGILGYEGYSPFKATFNKSYKVKVLESPQEMRNIITELNNSFNPSRIIAGYTHIWKSLDEATRKINPIPFEQTSFDFEYEDGFKMRWNKGMGLVDSDYSYLADPDSINQIGCIHTIQGLDLQYAGVIIGKDLIYRDGKIQFDKNANVDNFSAKISSSNDDDAIKYIRNTYNVLLTRGMRGTFIYCEDKMLNDYIKSLIVLDDQN